jgi:hypothetical protein
MAPEETEEKAGTGQVNLNTVLLTICITLSGWALYSINQLDEKIAGMMPLININSSAVDGINKVNGEQSNKIENILNRLTAIETKQSDSKNKN